MSPCALLKTMCSSCLSLSAIIIADLVNGGGLLCWRGELVLDLDVGLAETAFD